MDFTHQELDGGIFVLIVDGDLDNSNSEQFLALGSSSQAVLYGWRGVFTPVQTVPANGVTAFASFTSATGEDIVIVANGGREGEREIASLVYRLTANEQLSMVRTHFAHN